MQTIPIIILAAGASRRLGRPKQLLAYKDRSLLWHTLSCALRVALADVYVVLGAHQENIAAAIPDLDVNIVHNPDWEQGLSSSVKAGLETLLCKHPEAGACLLTVCDQPYLNTSLMQQMADIWQQSGKGIVAASYAGTTGTPVLFTKKYFAALLLLQKDEGAKKLIYAHQEDLITVPFAGGETDIDTMEDYQKLIHADR